MKDYTANYTTTTTQKLYKLTEGETIQFPAEKYLSVSAMCSSCGFRWGRKFSIRRDNETRTFTVTRKS